MPKKTTNPVGRPVVHPAEDCKRLMTRSTVAEYTNWIEAAKIEAQRLGIPIERLTIGVWSRMVLNQRAKELGLPPLSESADVS